MNPEQIAQRMALLQQWMGGQIAARQAELYPERPWPTPHIIADATVVIAPGNDSVYPSQNPNRVEHFGTAGLASKPILSEIVDLYRSAGVARFFVYISPSRQADEISEWLSAFGMEKVNELSVLWLPAQHRARPECDFEIRVSRPGHADLLRRVVEDGDEFGYSVGTLDMLGSPGFFTMHASEGDEAVATGSLYVHRGLGYLGNGKTLEPYRNRGAQTALIAARLGLASALGCTDTVSETYRFLETSFRNLQKAGFRELYARSIYRWER